MPPISLFLPQAFFLVFVLFCTTSAGFAQELIPDPPMDSEQYREWYDQHQTRFYSALKLLEKDLKSSPNDSQLLFKKAAALMATGNYGKAIAAFDAAGKSNPKDDRVWFHLARCYHHSQQYRDAIIYYKKYGDLHPDDPIPALAIVNILFLVEEKGQALSLSEQLAVSFPQSVKVQSHLAEVYSNNKKETESLRLYEQIVKKWPEEMEVLQKLVSIYSRVKRGAEAMNLAQQATKQYPQNPEAWDALGSVYLYEDKLEEAFRAYDTAHKFRVNSKPQLGPFYSIGFDCIRIRNFELALQCYQRILQISPGEADALHRLGRVYALTGKKKEAQDTQKLLKSLDKELANQLKDEISHPEKIEPLYVNTCSTNPNDSNAPQSVRPVILSKEKAVYTELASSNRVRGTVMVSMIFTAEGRLTGGRIVRGLPDGLNDEAMKAAKKIRYRPACKNGKPVSVRMSMEFTFNLL